MAKKSKKKARKAKKAKAKEQGTVAALERLFGKGAAKRVRKLAAQMAVKKTPPKKKKTN